MSDRPFDEGDVLTLDDSTPVKVIGIKEMITGDAWKQTVHVGDV